MKHLKETAKSVTLLLLTVSYVIKRRSMSFDCLLKGREITADFVQNSGPF